MLWDKVKLVPKKQIYFGLLGAVLFFFSLFFLSSNRTNLALLYKPSDATEIAELLYVLNKSGINYVQKEGAIYVNSENLQTARITLAEEGLPRNGSTIGYEIFNKSEFLGTSNFAQNVNLLRALEGELSRTLSSFESIKNARVHLVLPKKELFMQSKHIPSASVTLQLYKDGDLSKKEIKAISHLVASAVPELDINNITIVGTDGRNYKLADGEEEHGSSSMYEYKITLERQIKDSIENLGFKTVGYGKIAAEVSIDIDMKYQITDSEIYDPNQQVIRSSHVLNEEGSETSGSSANVSVQNNIPNQSPTQQSGGDASNNRKTEEMFNYEISRSINKISYFPGSIKNISIGILVDGEYEADADGVIQYKPRSDEFIESFKTLVVSAVGIDYDRGDKLEIVNIKFSEDDILESGELGFINDIEDIYPIVSTVVYGIVAILGMFIFSRPIVSVINQIYGAKNTKDANNILVDEIGNQIEDDANKQETSKFEEDGEEAGDFLSALEENEDIDLYGINLDNTDRNMSIIHAFIAKRPDTFVNVLRSMIFNDEKNPK
ncbi:flagellar M-ring protein FliF [Anaplasmataceae bacterium AB001_6]|nr:flagellar M-ring protein FliF [Anaplasmataceae bacterium AB001_6]